jgi:hypothetical protein
MSGFTITREEGRPVVTESWLEPRIKQEAGVEIDVSDYDRVSVSPVVSQEDHAA